MIKRLIGNASIHPVFFYSGKFAGYFIWVYAVWRAFGQKPGGIIPNLYAECISIALLIAALLMVVLSLINLGKSTRLGLPTENTIFKSGGLYRISRNPMYVGFNLLSIAALVYLQSILVLVAAAYSIAIYHFIILAEEKFLLQRFRHQYQQYSKKVRRYL